MGTNTKNDIFVILTPICMRFYSLNYQNIPFGSVLTDLLQCHSSRFRDACGQI